VLFNQKSFKLAKVRGYDKIEKFLDSRKRDLTNFNGYVILKYNRGKVK